MKQDQSTLDFTRTHTHTKSHDTEIEAAEGVAPKATANCLRLLRHVASAGPITRDEANTRFNKENSDAPFVAGQRMSDLYELGLVDTHPVKGVSALGHPAKRWEVTNAGRE